MAEAQQHIAPKSFSTGLIDRVGSIGKVLSEFLDSERSDIQAELKERFPKADSMAVDLLLNAFVTVDGTKKPLKMDEINIHQITKEQLLFCLNRLERGRILRLDDDTYELAHDTLAGHIHSQRSAEEIGLLEAAGVVKNRWKDFRKTETLMNAKEVDLVSIYIDTLDERQILTDEELAFVRRSIADVKRKRLARRITIGAVMFILALTTVWALMQQRKARAAQAMAEAATVEAQGNYAKLQDQTFMTAQADYNGLIDRGIQLTENDPPDYEAAAQLFDQASTIADEYGQDERFDHGEVGAAMLKDSAEMLLPLKDQFNAMMEQGLRTENEGYHRYLAALRIYRDARALNYNNKSADLSIELLTDKLPIAFEQLRKDGDTYYEAGKLVNSRPGWESALKRYKQAAAIQIPGVDRVHVLNRIQECEEVLK